MSVTVRESVQSLNGRALWLEADEAPVYAVLHAPAPCDQRNTAVLILPPFGWEGVCSYRSRRHWAIELARAGFPAARIDLPATGDSGGDASDVGMLDRWDVAACAALDWLLGLAGITRLAVIGIRLGGLLAIRALASGAQVDDLVLWGVPASGKTYVRELRIHSEVVASNSYEAGESQVNSDGTLALTGYVLKPATVAALEAIDLAAVALPDLSGRRALLIERDRLGVDRKLTAALSRAGAQTQTLPANDYRLLMTDPLERGTPGESITRTIDWLSATAGPADSSDEASPSRLTEAFRDETTMVVDGVKLTERLLGYDGRAGRMVGVLTKPADHEPRLPVCIVLLAPGRRIGANRMWVETARRWAARGVQSVRFDTEGFGDSDGDGDGFTMASLYAPRMTANVKELLDHLTQMGIADQFVMVGLCASAYWSFHAAIEEPRILGMTLVNQWSFDFSERLIAERDRARAGEVLRREMLTRVAKGVRQGWIGPSDLRRALLAFRPSARRGASEEAVQHSSIQGWLSTLTANGTDVAMIFSTHEALYEQIVRFGYNDRPELWPNLFIDRTTVRDHHIRAPWAQALVSDRIDAALRRQLALDSNPAKSLPDSA